MSKFNITAEFSLMTEIEPEISSYAFSTISPERLGVEDFEDSSYFAPEQISISGGELTFVIEAENETDAERKVEETIYSGMEVEDNNNLTWVVDDLNFEIEPQEEPMDVTRATELISKFIGDYPTMNPELKEAFLFLLRLIAERS